MDLLELLYTRDSNIEPSLEGIELLCRGEGDPQHAFQAIQVTGTNGKGSTARICSSLLQANGKKAGLYTSPHLISFTERIAVAGVPISEKRLLQGISALLPSIQKTERELGRKLTGFEILTALAFNHFKEEGVDAAVLEVGMGGRWDATSVCSSKVGVITNIELDHTDYLGTTRAEIAQEKAGVIPFGGTAVIAEEDSGLKSIFKREAQGKSATLYYYNEDFFTQIKGRQLMVSAMGSDYKVDLSSIPPSYQRKNIAAGVAAAQCFLERPLDAGSAQDVLSDLFFPGRMELIKGVVLDGAHNPAAAAALKRALLRKYGNREMVLLMAILEDKDAEEILKQLAPVAREIVVSENESPRRIPAEKLREIAERHHPKVFCDNDFTRALEKARGLAAGDDLVVITGSLYTVGLARGLLLEEP